MFQNRLFQDLAPLAGRLALSALFIAAGYQKMTDYQGLVGAIESKGIFLPEIAAVLTILIELVGGIMIALGLKARWAALGIALFLIPVSYLFHPFWADQAQFNAFFKNLCIFGGMLYVAAYGPGRFSLTRD